MSEFSERIVTKGRKFESVPATGSVYQMLLPVISCRLGGVMTALTGKAA